MGILGLYFEIQIFKQWRCPKKNVQIKSLEYDFEQIILDTRKKWAETILEHQKF